MPIQYRFFSIPVNNEAEAEEGLNQALRGARAVVVQREPICQDERYYWAIAVECAVGTGKGRAKVEIAEKRIDYKEVLSPEDFVVYAKPREWRKEAAAREGVQLPVGEPQPQQRVPACPLHSSPGRRIPAC
jgi:hypothetical protein